MSGTGSNPPRRTDTVGYSATPTLYRLHWDKHLDHEYVNCGADLLLNGLQGDLEAEAHCPVCGKSTQLVIADGKIDGLEPDDALIHVVEMPTNSGRIWIECESTHIFDRRTCFEQWSERNKGQTGVVAPVREYHERLLEKRSSSQKLPKEKPITGVS